MGTGPARTKPSGPRWPRCRRWGPGGRRAYRPPLAKRLSAAPAGAKARPPPHRKWPWPRRGARRSLRLRSLHRAARPRASPRLRTAALTVEPQMPSTQSAAPTPRPPCLRRRKVHLPGGARGRLGPLQGPAPPGLQLGARSQLPLSSRRAGARSAGALCAASTPTRREAARCLASGGPGVQRCLQSVAGACDQAMATQGPQGTKGKRRGASHQGSK